MRARLQLGAAVVCATLAVLALASGTVHGQLPGRQPRSPGAPGVHLPRAQLLAQGRALYQSGCSSCHGFDLRGIRGRGPNLVGVGELAADFYIRTGRMPLPVPDQEPIRRNSQYTRLQQAAIIAFVGSFGGPAIPRVDPRRGDMADGLRLFEENCMSCHQVVSRGGITTTGIAPILQPAKPVDVGEVVRIGPYVMPRFPQLTQSDVDSLARYVTYTQHPDDIGGWGIGHIGPIYEGLVAWLLGGMALFLIIRVIGERTTE